MISYKFIIILGLSIVKRSSCEDVAECEEALRKFGLVYDSGFLNYVYLKQYASTLPSDSDLVKFKENFNEQNNKAIDISTDTEIGYLENYYKKLFEIKSEIKNDLNVNCPSKYCIYNLQRLKHKELDKKMDEILKEPIQSSCLGIFLKSVNVDVIDLPKLIKECKNEIFDFSFEIEIGNEKFVKKFHQTNPYRNIMIVVDVFKKVKIDPFYSHQMKGYVSGYCSYNLEVIGKGYDIDDKQGDENVYKNCIVSNFCRKYYSEKYP